MAEQGLSVGVVGGGIGGLAAALSLLRQGFDVQVYEQASVLSEVGAGVQVSPNASRILHGLGLAVELAGMGVRPLAWHQRRRREGWTPLAPPGLGGRRGPPSPPPGAAPSGPRGGGGGPGGGGGGPLGAWSGRGGPPRGRAPGCCGRWGGGGRGGRGGGGGGGPPAGGGGGESLGAPWAERPPDRRGRPLDGRGLATGTRRPSPPRRRARAEGATRRWRAGRRTSRSPPSLALRARRSAV